MKITNMDAPACDEYLAQLAALLQDALEQGAALGFPVSFDEADALRYWQGVRQDVAAGTRVLLAATHEGVLLGAVQVALCPQAWGSGRAELQKMIVHSRVRRRGIGSVLLRAAEAEAKELGRGLLSLDAEPGSAAEQLYQWLGYDRVGDLPGRPSAVWAKDLFAAVAA